MPYYNLGFVFIALVVSNIGYNNIFLKVSIAKVSKHDSIAKNRSNRDTSKSSQCALLGTEGQS